MHEDFEYHNQQQQQQQHQNQQQSVTMKNTYIDANPAVTYYVDKKRFGPPEQPAEQTSKNTRGTAR
jgi:hypothetical protein